MTSKKMVSKKTIAQTAGIAILLILSFLLASLTYDTHRAKKHTDKKEYAQAIDTLLGGRVNMIERYKLYYNRGTALANNKQYNPAIVEFSRALSRAQDEKSRCMIAWNLVLTEEAAGDRAVKLKEPTQAAQHYQQGLDAIEADPVCFENKETEGRVGDKLKSLQSATSPQKTPENKGGGSDASDKVRKLEEKAAQSRAETIAGTKSYDQDVDQGVEKPW